MSLPELEDLKKYVELTGTHWEFLSEWYYHTNGTDYEGKEVDIWKMKTDAMSITPSIFKDLFDACEEYKKINALGICPRMYGMFTDTDTDKKPNIYLVFQKIQGIFCGDISSDVFLETIHTKMCELLNKIHESGHKILLRSDDMILHDFKNVRDFKIMIKRSHVFEEIIKRAAGTYTDTYISVSNGGKFFPYFVPHEKKTGIGSEWTAWTTWKPDSEKSVLDYYLYNMYILGSIIINHSRVIYCFMLNNDYLVHDKLYYSNDKLRRLWWRKVDGDTVHIHEDDNSLTEERIQTKIRRNTSLLNKIKKCVAPDPNDRMDHTKDMIPNPEEKVFAVNPLIPLPKNPVSTEISDIPVNVSEDKHIIESIAVHGPPPEEESAWVILRDERYVSEGKTIAELKLFMEEVLGIYQDSDIGLCTLKNIMSFKPFLKDIPFNKFVKAMGFDPNII